jgi:hypothetical protein
VGLPGIAHGGQGGSLVPPHTRWSVSLYLSVFTVVAVCRTPGESAVDKTWASDQANFADSAGVYATQTRHTPTLAGIARYDAGCHLTQETRGQDALDDAAGNQGLTLVYLSAQSEPHLSLTDRHQAAYATKSAYVELDEWTSVSPCWQCL